MQKQGFRRNIREIEMINSHDVNHLNFIQVMIQPHNIHMSFSLYICALAVADTIALLNGKYTSLIHKET